MLKFLGGSGNECTIVVPLTVMRSPCACDTVLAVHLVLIRLPAECQQSGVPCEVSSGNEYGEGCMDSSSATLVRLQSQAFNVN